MLDTNPDIKKLKIYPPVICPALRCAYKQSD